MNSQSTNQKPGNIALLRFSFVFMGLFAFVATSPLVRAQTYTKPTFYLVPNPSGEGMSGENVGKIKYLVRLFPASTSVTSVQYTTLENQAKAGEDFEANSGTLVFLPGETEKAFEVTIIDDKVAEANEYFGVQISNPQNAELDANKSGSARLIVDNDSGSTARFVAFESSTYTVQEGADKVQLTVKLSGSWAGPGSATVKYATADGEGAQGAKAGLDYTQAAGTITFNVGDSSKTIEIPISQDPFPEGSETFKVKLSDPSPAASLWIGAPEEATVTVTDAPLPTVQFASPSYAVAEKDTELVTLEVKVTLSATPPGPVTVEYATGEEGTAQATAGTDYVPKSGVLTFTPQDASLEQIIKIDILPDKTPELSETFQVTLSSPTGAVLGTSKSTVTIQDDDSPLTSIQFSSATYSAGEASGQAAIRAGCIRV